MEAELEDKRLLLDGILTNSQDGVLAFESVRDADGQLKDFRFTLVNPSAEILAKMPASALLGRRLLEVFPNVRADGLFDRYVEIVEMGLRQEFEYCSKRTDPPRWYRITGAKLRDGLSVSYMEITERRRTEEILRESEERFSSAFAYATTGMALVSLEGRWIKVNQAICHSLGYTAEELRSKTFQDITHPDDLAIDLANAQKLIRGEMAYYKMEKRYFHKDGRVVWALLGVSLIRDKENKPLYFISQIEDISEMKQAMIRQRELTEKAQAAEKAKSEFLANMSHELRTPLNGIIGFSELLADELPGKVNADQKEYLTDILHSSRHLLQLINDVLDLAKVESGKMELYPEPFLLSAAIEQVCSVSYPLVQKKKIRLTTSIPPEMDEVTLDPQKLKQVVYNLLSNAVKFSHERGQIEITVKPVETDRFAISVSDSGIGIRPENLARLFKDFEQLDEGPTRRYQGTGLGLALIRRIVEMQNGTVEVESEFGKGSTFTVTLPVRLKKASL